MSTPTTSMPAGREAVGDATVAARRVEDAVARGQAEQVDDLGHLCVGPVFAQVLVGEVEVVVAEGLFEVERVHHHDCTEPAAPRSACRGTLVPWRPSTWPEWPTAARGWTRLPPGRAPGPCGSVVSPPSRPREPRTSCRAASRSTVTWSSRPSTPSRSRRCALRRIENIEANPAASLLIDHFAEDWARLWWVRIDARGRVVPAGAERRRALDLLASKYEQYRAVRPPGPVLALDIVAWRSWEATASETSGTPETSGTRRRPAPMRGT